jgi:N-acetylneuraminic acid mutarotase
VCSVVCIKRGDDEQEKDSKTSVQDIEGIYVDLSTMQYKYLRNVALYDTSHHTHHNYNRKITQQKQSRQYNIFKVSLYKS